MSVSTERKAKKSGSSHQGSFAPVLCLCVSSVVVVVAVSPTAYASLPTSQRVLTLQDAISVAAESAPTVNARTLLAFAYYESKLHPFAVHDNTTGRTALPATPADATTLARSLLAQGHSLDLGVMQVNSANLARTGLTVASAFDAAASMNAGGAILVDAYHQCLHGNRAATHAEQQAALRCAASVYNTGREAAGVVNGYQGRVWRVAAQIVPAIELAGQDAASSPAAPEGVALPEPRRQPLRMEDALHATTPVPGDDDGMGDALHPNHKGSPQ